MVLLFKLGVEMEQEQEKIDIEKIQQLTPEQKKTLWEWVKYLSKSLFIAVLKKLTGTV
jgi:hypothetical protein